ncbi:MAG TPA: LysM peptidoglycan-binding domain-containing protein, partial [Cellulomonas sp.]
AARIRVGQRLVIPSSSTAAPAAAPAAAVAAPAAATYTVAAGDTVSRIATKQRTTIAAIVAANGLDARGFIRIGQQLTIPGAAAAATVKPAATATLVSATTTTTTTTTHTVASGETVSGIAKKLGTTVQAIVAANGLNARAFVRIGQQLTIPVTTTAAAPATVQLVSNTFAGRTYSDAVVAAANVNQITLLSSSVPTKAQMQAKIVATARQMGVDPSLAQAIAFQESGFQHTVVSPANAIGTMQVIPSSGAWASQLVGRTLNLLNPDDNVVAGIAILRSLVKTSPDLSTAIAGYYQGAASVRNNGMFADTRRYVANVQTHMTRFS